MSYIMVLSVVNKWFSHRENGFGRAALIILFTQDEGANELCAV